MTPPLWQKKTEDLKVSWWKWKRAWKNDLKFNIQETKIMVSGPITSWQIDREKMLTLFILLVDGGSKSLQMVNVAMKLKDVSSLKENLWATYTVH